MQVQHLGRTLVELWRVMEMPIEEQIRFDPVTRLITSTFGEVQGPGSLSVDVIEQVHFPKL